MSDRLDRSYDVSADPERFRLRRFLQNCIRYRWMVVTLFLGSVSVALAIAVFSEKIYEGRVLMAPVKQDTQQSRLAAMAGQLGGLVAQLGLMGGIADNTQEAIATLRSRLFLESFIKDYDLLPILFHDLWDPKNKRWVVDDPTEIPSTADAYEMFDDDILTVSEDTQTGLVTLTIEWRERERVKEWANVLVERVNRIMRDRAISEAERGIKYLNEQLEQTDVIELRLAIFRLIETNIQTVMLAKVRDDFAFRVIDPAVTPEGGRFVRPKRLLLLAIGVVFGAFLCIFAVMLRVSWSAEDAERTDGPRPA
jgi:uncharacterized protein involved in exopolysaccharide biosynthesis